MTQPEGFLAKPVGLVAEAPLEVTTPQATSYSFYFKVGVYYYIVALFALVGIALYLHFDNQKNPEKYRKQQELKERLNAMENFDGYQRV